MISTSVRFGAALLAAAILWAGCAGKQEADTLFEKIPPSKSGIRFVNTVKNSEDFNIFSYRNFYNGGGVAIGDINNDGLPDLYLTANMGQNKLYLNKGNFQFEDISEKSGAGSSKSWSTGVVMVDVNADGWLDIYVCNAGYLKGQTPENELFINNHDLTFTERAADFNLNDSGYTTHAAFFDYDLDGDLDCYILNNSFMPVNTLNYSNKREVYAKDWPVKDFLKGGGDKLLRNDFIPPLGEKQGGFTDVTEQAGIYGSLIGFGLGITVGDINGDNLPDMYVSNDFFERDYLYVNQGDGTFKEEIENWMQHLSHASMGADMADINNDAYPEIFVTEMLPDDEYRLKTTTLFENYNVYQLKQERDFYHQYMQNTLQLNNKDQTFSEIAYFSGVAASDWSWGALMFDADNDGLRDIYICNGIYQDVIDQDFVNFFADEIVQKMVLTGKKEEFESIVEKMPSNPVANKFFRNRGDLTFEDVGKQWGTSEPSFSNGAAYGDLDGDGDLDLVVNNVNQEVFLFKNNAAGKTGHHFLAVNLEGEGANTRAIGAKVFIHKKNEILNFQLIPSRGFQSSVDYKMIFGLGAEANVDSLVVIWPDRRKTLLQRPPVDTTLTLSQSAATAVAVQPADVISQKENRLLEEVSSPFATHREDFFIDFYQEGLTMRMLSREGPKAAKADVNGDGLEDIFTGGAAGQAGKLYLQTPDGNFAPGNNAPFELDANFEDTALRFFDADGDGDADLFVGSGGNHQPARSRFMQDRLYFNDGSGNFTLDERALTLNGFNTAVAVPLDFDADGDLDLYVGSRSVPGQYGVAPKSFIYENDGKGKFRDVAEKVAPKLYSGMITDAAAVDLTGDGQPELVLVGEWMSPWIYKIENGQFSILPTNLKDYPGWWYAAEPADLDGDGDLDLVLGNRGENFYFTGSPDAPAKLWVNDFDENGTVEKIITRSIGGKDMPLPSKADLTSQIVSLKKQNLKHTEYATKAIQDLFSNEILEKTLVWNATWFKSAVAINEGGGRFTVQPLPKEVQFSCVCGIACTDLDGNGTKDIVLAGNDSGFTPQFSKLDASFGHVLLNDGQGNFNRLENRLSGFFVKGDVREILTVDTRAGRFILATVNGQPPEFFKVKNPVQ